MSARFIISSRRRLPRATPSHPPVSPSDTASMVGNSCGSRCSIRKNNVCLTYEVPSDARRDCRRNTPSSYKSDFAIEQNRGQHGFHTVLIVVGEAADQFGEKAWSTETARPGPEVDARSEVEGVRANRTRDDPPLRSYAAAHSTTLSPSISPNSWDLCRRRSRSGPPRPLQEDARAPSSFSTWFIMNPGSRPRFQDSRIWSSPCPVKSPESRAASPPDVESKTASCGSRGRGSRFVCRFRL